MKLYNPTLTLTSTMIMVYTKPRDTSTGWQRYLINPRLVRKQGKSLYGYMQPSSGTLIRFTTLLTNQVPTPCDCIVSMGKAFGLGGKGVSIPLVTKFICINIMVWASKIITLGGLKDP